MVLCGAVFYAVLKGRCAKLIIAHISFTLFHAFWVQAILCREVYAPSRLLVWYNNSYVYTMYGRDDEGFAWLRSGDLRKWLDSDAAGDVSEVISKSK